MRQPDVVKLSRPHYLFTLQKSFVSFYHILCMLFEMMLNGEDFVDTLHSQQWSVIVHEFKSDVIFGSFSFGQ